MSFLEEEASRNGKSVIFIEKGKVGESMEKLFLELKNQNLKKFGIFIKEQQKGTMIQEFDKEFLKNGLEAVDVTNDIQKFLSVKDKIDIQLVKKSTQVTCHFFKKLIEEIEYHVDQETKVKHSLISKKIDQQQEKQKHSLASRFSIVPQFYDFSYVPVV